MTEISPITRTKIEARRYYDRISKYYDFLSISEQPLIRQGVSLLSIKPQEQILELGSGTGTGLSQIVERLSPAGLVIGLDISHQMLLHSQNKTNHKDVLPVYLQGDATRIPLRSGSFDAVFASFTLELFSIKDIHRVLSECSRVLKPAGRLCLVSLVQSPRTLSLQLYKLAHRLFPVAVDCRPIPLADLLTNNGFQIKRSQKALNWGLPIDLTLSIKQI